MNNITIPSDFTVDLRDLMPILDHNNISKLRSRYQTFCRKCNLAENGHRSKSTMYVDFETGRPVQTYLMTPDVAKAFCVYVDPLKGLQLLERLAASLPATQPDPYREVTIPAKWVLEHFKERSASSIFSTLKQARARAVGTELEHDWGYKDGEMHMSPMFLLAVQFTKVDGFAFKAFVASVMHTDLLPAPVTVLALEG